MFRQGAGVAEVNQEGPPSSRLGVESTDAKKALGRF